MPNPYFQFKQFTIYQDRCSMKVGTDGVLLGAWADCSSSQNILDIGTGTGLIALMLAQRSPKAIIHAVEIDEESSTQAMENILSSPFSEQIKIYNTSIQSFSNEATETFDLIVSNPPYFENNLKCPSENRSLARHTDALSFEELIDCALHLLAPNGKFCVILPTEEAIRFSLLAQQKGLFLSHQTKVFPLVEKEEKRRLLCFSQENVPTTEDSLIIELERHIYTEEFKMLTKDFYLDKK